MSIILFYIILTGIVTAYVLHESKEGSSRQGWLHIVFSFLCGWWIIPASCFDTLLKFREEMARVRLKEGRLTDDFSIAC